MVIYNYWLIIGNLIFKLISLNSSIKHPELHWYNRAVTARMHLYFHYSFKKSIALMSMGCLSCIRTSVIVFQYFYIYTIYVYTIKSSQYIKERILDTT